jgi:hypothetical protein
MMATTHAFTGLALAAALVVAVPGLSPEVAFAAAVGGLVGGAFPDLDMLGTHRRTLHYPEYYWVLAVPLVGAAVVLQTPLAVGAAVFAVAAAVHSVSDVFGGGLETRPWEGRSDKGVYFHAGKRWLAPKQWVRYDGAPEDLALAAVLALPGLYAFDGVVETVVLVGLAVSVVYTVFRKKLVEVAPERFL